MAQGIATRSSRAHRTICLPIKEEDYLRVKSGVSSSFLSGKFGEIRCQFIILARKDELTPRGSTPRGSPSRVAPKSAGLGLSRRISQASPKSGIISRVQVSSSLPKLT